ncbi:hypothetical protein [Robertmurraya siralis]|uniref:hypothetical protein n=1 Tax=Robertmurraya siralis TaxID=77777 RepID=UPI001BB43C84|nr:hypothetical protein [Robertmurraya siralis]
MKPVLDRANSLGFDIFNYHINVTDLPSEDDLKKLKAIEDIIMVGYPNGLWDEHNNLPIFRKGITETHPNIDYDGKVQFLIDCACFPGSSGSPVVILNEGLFSSREAVIAGDRLIFLSILFAGPIYNVEGEYL